MKRSTVHVFKAGEFGLAFSVCRYLKHHGVDAVLVTKHAVQIHPDHGQKTSEVLQAYRWGWERTPQPGEEALP